MITKEFNLILISLFLFYVTFGMIFGLANADISEITCSVEKPCSGGMECISFPGIGLKCAQPNPCNYFKCPGGTQCNLAESYPPQLICSRPCTGEECDIANKPVSYNVLTQTVVHTVDQNQQTVSHNISLWKTTDENRGILETPTASVGYSGKIVVKNSKLFMDIAAVEKPINILPEDAISKAKGIAETPEIKKVELKAEAENPVYSVIGMKHAKLIAFIPVILEIETKVDAGSSEIISVNKPWWSFLVW
jgi:hypothetical protein